MTINPAVPVIADATTAPMPIDSAPLQAIRLGHVFRAFLGRVFNPRDLWTATQLWWNRKAHRHTYDNAQLALYSRILPGDFLHFGYFDQTDLLPEETRLADVTRAQQKYADLLLELIGNRDQPVLDVGCGMGGLSRMLLERGFQPTAITPDRLQVAHIKATLPQVPIVRTKFENLDPAAYAGRFGTVYTSESLQYLKLDAALPLLKSVLAPGGKWVACDFFHIRPSRERACHHWEEFVEKVTAGGWKITYQRDITANVLPTLRYIHMWAERFGIPLMQFSVMRLRRKQPGLHHLMAKSFNLLEAMAGQKLATIDPVLFAREKRYMMLVMERANQAN